MRAILILAVRLYPRQWRARYGLEFAALLENLDPTWSDVLDVALGGLTMRFTRSKLLVPAIVCGVIGLCAAVLLSVMIPRRFASGAIMRLTSDDSFDAAVMQSIKSAVSTLALSPRDISVHRIDGSERMFYVSVHDADANKAHETAKALTQQVASANQQSRAVEILEVPNFPQSRGGPPIPAVAFLGLTAGSVIGMFIGLIRSRTSTTV